jgi:hypothetical protein
MVVATTVPALFSSFTVTPTTPASLASWMPSLSQSAHTLSPMEAFWYRPASQDRSASPVASVVTMVLPVVGSKSLSVASLPP